MAAALDAPGNGPGTNGAPLAAAPPVHEDPGPDLETAGLDRVRDILFGRQVRSLSERMDRFEARMLETVAQSQAAMLKRIDSVESWARGEFHAAVERDRVEKRERGDADDAVRASIEALSKSLERRLADIEEQMSAADAELRDAILDQSKSLRSELSEANSTLRETLRSETSELRRRKADRTAIASLLNDVAVRLSDDDGE